MTTIKRTSTATWGGGIESGSGRIGVGRSDVVLPFSLKTRIGANPSTNPEELLGSALAGCYSMSLAGELDGNGTPAELITSTATVHLVGGDGGFSIPTVDLVVTAVVPGVTDADFQEVARRAHEGCPVSRLFDADVRLTATLDAPARGGQPVHFRETASQETDGGREYVPHSDLTGSGLELSVLVLDTGVSRNVAEGRDELLYLLSGAAELRVGGATHAIEQNGAARIPAGHAYTLVRTGEEACEVAIVSGRAGTDGGSPAPVCLDLADQSKHPAVSDREFQLLFHPDTGCTGMTQFVGYVPKVRTPRHIHPYSEMLCIVRGHGVVEIDGQETEVGPGYCYYLPAGTPHLVQNSADEPLIELGVFTPAGSPAQNTPVE